MSIEGIVIDGTHYKDTGCKFNDSCLECPFEECEYEKLYKSKIVYKDMRFLGWVSRYIKQGGYDMCDGRLPYPEAMTKVLLRAKKRNEKYGWTTTHIDQWLEELEVG